MAAADQAALGPGHVPYEQDSLTVLDCTSRRDCFKNHFDDTNFGEIIAKYGSVTVYAEEADHASRPQLLDKDEINQWLALNLGKDALRIDVFAAPTDSQSRTAYIFPTLTFIPMFEHNYAAIRYISLLAMAHEAQKAVDEGERKEREGVALEAVQVEQVGLARDLLASMPSALEMARLGCEEIANALDAALEHPQAAQHPSLVALYAELLSCFEEAANALSTYKSTEEWHQFEQTMNAAQGQLHPRPPERLQILWRQYRECAQPVEFFEDRYPALTYAFRAMNTD